MSYLLNGSADAMGNELGAYVGEGEMGGYMGDGLDGYVGAGTVLRHPHAHRMQPNGHPAQPAFTTFEQPLPIPETTFTASQTLDVNAFPQRGFKPHRLVVPSTLGPLFKINDIKVGQETQFVASGTIYGECFSEVAVAVYLKGTPARLGNNIVLNVTNRDTVNSQVFSAMLMGYTEST